MSNCFMTPWTEACQGFSLFMGFPRQEYWSEFPFPSQGNFDDPEMKLVSPAFQDSFPLSHQGSPYIHAYIIYKYTYILGSLFPFKFCYNTFYFWRFSQSVPVPMPFILFYFMVFNSLFFSYHFIISSDYSCRYYRLFSSYSMFSVPFLSNFHYILQNKRQ